MTYDEAVERAADAILAYQENAIEGSGHYTGDSAANIIEQAVGSTFSLDHPKWGLFREAIQTAKASTSYASIRTAKAKACSMCGETKPGDAFYDSPGNVDGLDYYCKPCRKEYDRDRKAS